MLATQPEGLVDVCFSPDSTKLITVCKNDTVQIWDLAKRSKIKELPAVAKTHYRSVFSPDGSKFIVQGNPTKVYRWPSLELENSFEFDGAFYFEGQLLLIKNPPSYGSGFAPDASYWDSRTMKEYVNSDLADQRGATLYGYNFERRIPRMVSIEARMPSPDGSQYLIWKRNYQRPGAADPIGPIVRVYDAGDRSLISELESEGELRAVAWSPDGQRIATGCSDGIARIWRQVSEGK